MVRAELRRLHAQGLTNNAIAVRLGCPVKAVRSALDNMGLKAHTRAARQARLRAAVASLHAEGLNDPEIAERISETTSTVHGVRSKMGLRALGRRSSRKRRTT